MIEADELWSVVGDKRNVWWVWVPLDANTRQVVGMVAGDRTEGTARRLWAAVPTECRGGAVVYTDVLAQYRAVIPAARHTATGGKGGVASPGVPSQPGGRFWRVTNRSGRRRSTGAELRGR